MRLFAGTVFDRPPMCDGCHKLESECECPPAQQKFRDPAKQTARLAVEKRKKGKIVTVIRGLNATDNDLPSLLKRLKNACGAGGSLDGDEMEIQGMHHKRLANELRALGYRVLDGK